MSERLFDSEPVLETGDIEEASGRKPGNLGLDDGTNPFSDEHLPNADDWDYPDVEEDGEGPNYEDYYIEPDDNESPL